MNNESNVNAKINYGKPGCMLEAQKNGKSKKLIIELLVFLLVFIISSVLQGAVISIVTTVQLFTTPGVFERIAELGREVMSGLDFDTALDEAINLMTGDFETVIIVTMFATALSILTAVFYCVKIEKRGLFSMGFVRGENIKGYAIKEYVTGFVVGAAMVSVPVLVGVVSGTLSISVNPGFSAVMLAVVFAGFIIQGASEEIMLRGYLLVSVSRRRALAPAVLVSSVAFGLLHIGNDGMTFLSFVNLVLFGAFAALYFIRRGSIWGIAALHASWNFVQGSIYGSAVSGNTITGSVFKTVASADYTFINGGSFGLEGGLGVTFVLLLGMTVLYFMKPSRVSGMSKNEVEGETQ